MDGKCKTRRKLRFVAIQLTYMQTHYMEDYMYMYVNLDVSYPVNKTDDLSLF